MRLTRSWVICPRTDNWWVALISETLLSLLWQWEKHPCLTLRPASLHVLWMCPSLTFSRTLLLPVFFLFHELSPPPYQIYYVSLSEYVFRILDDFGEPVVTQYFKYMYLESECCSVVSDSLQPHRLDSPWNSPGQNTAVGSLSLLQGIFPTQGSNQGLLHCRRILYQLSYQGSPYVS